MSHTTPAIAVAELHSKWPEFLREMAQYHPRAAEMMSKFRPANIDGNMVFLHTGDVKAFARLREDRHKEGVVEKALERVHGVRLYIRVMFRPDADDPKTAELDRAILLVESSLPPSDPAPMWEIDENHVARLRQWIDSPPLEPQRAVPPMMDEDFGASDVTNKDGGSAFEAYFAEGDDESSITIYEDLRMTVSGAMTTGEAQDLLAKANHYLHEWARARMLPSHIEPPQPDDPPTSISDIPF